jgi:hypothetical protein
MFSYNYYRSLSNGENPRLDGSKANRRIRGEPGVKPAWLNERHRRAENETGRGSPGLPLIH